MQLSPAQRAIVAAAGRVVLFVVLVLVFAAVFEGLLSAPLARLANRLGPGIKLGPLLQLLAVGTATVVIVRMIDRRPWSELALGRDAARWPAFGEGLAAGALTACIASLVLLAVGMLHFTPSAPAGGWLAAAARVSLVLVPAALAEELLCRGYLLTVFGSAIGRWGAVVLTSAAFGLLHLANPGATATSVTVVTLSGAFLALLRLALGSVYAAWMAHLAWNWIIAVALHATLSGLRFESPGYSVVTSGPAWIAGGSWGPEGGVVAALGMLGATYFYARRRREES
ncbi:MAG: CPBP family intramembrane metalloprotease [Gemmatimonadaceae bacterium]|nr:CPBP family intramembrane metalloprotease [Gemmatimonadaceae bacterium]